MTDRDWEVCRGACEELRPVASRFQEDLTTGERVEGGLPYCQECTAHRLQLEVFPDALEDIPVYFEDANGDLHYEGTLGDEGAGA